MLNVAEIFDGEGWIMPRARDALLPAATGDAYLVDRGALK